MSTNEKKSADKDPNKVYGNPVYGPKDDIYSQEDKVPFNDPGNEGRIEEDEEDDNDGNTVEDIKDEKN